MSLKRPPIKECFMYAKGGKTEDIYLKKGDVIKFKNGERIRIIGPKGDGYDYQDGKEKGHHPKGWFDMMISSGKAEVVYERGGMTYTEDEIKYALGVDDDYEYWVELAFQRGYKYDESKDEWYLPEDYAKGGKVKRYIVHKGSGYDGEVLGSSDTYRGAKQILTRLEKKGVFDDVDTYGIKDTEDYFYRRKDNKYAKGGRVKYLSDYINDKNSKLFEETGTFFAFSNEQFKEQMKKGKKYVNMGGGMITEKGNEEKLVKGLNKNYKEGIKQDLKENGKEKIILRELQNYEAFYTGNIDDTVENLKDYPGITKEDIMKSYRKNYSKIFRFCKRGCYI